MTRRKLSNPVVNLLATCAPRARAMLGLALGLGLAGGLAGCGPLVKFGEDGPPPSLFALRSVEPEGIQARALATPLLVAPPDTIAELRPPRIAVFTSLTGVSYLPASRWIDPPARLMTRLLEDRLRQASTGIVITPRQFEVGYKYRLNSRLTGFHVDAQSGRHIARVELEASLITAPNANTPEQEMVGTRRFSAERELASVEPRHVSENLNAAANDVMTQLVDWLASLGPNPQGRTPAPAQELTPPTEVPPEGAK